MRWMDRRYRGVSRASERQRLRLCARYTRREGAVDGERDEKGRKDREVLIVASIGETGCRVGIARRIDAA